MNDEHVKFIKDWRKRCPLVEVAGQPFQEREAAYNFFADAVAETMKPHFEEFGIPAASLLEGFVLRDIMSRVPASNNYFRNGLIRTITQALKIPQPFFDEMLILEAYCRYEVRVLKAWPALTARFHDYFPTSQKELAALATFTEGRAFDAAPEPIPPISKGPYKWQDLAYCANLASAAAHSRLNHPEREIRLRRHPKFERVHRIFLTRSDELIEKITGRITEFLNSNSLLPPPVHGTQALEAFLLENCLHDADSFFRTVFVKVASLVPPGPDSPSNDYAAQPWQTASAVRNFNLSLLSSLKSLEEIPPIC